MSTVDADQTGVVAGITPLILTFNEAPNIGRCLDRLTWAREIIVLDSGSTDETRRIARGYANVRWHTRRFDSHAGQCNHGISLVQTPWVLSLDADYIVPASFPAEAAAAMSESAHDAAFVTFRYLICGRPLRGSLYPPRAVLFRRDRCSYVNDGHAHRLKVTGPTVTLSSRFDHDDRKPLREWMQAQNRYASLEVDKLLVTPPSRLPFQDRARRWIAFGPPAIFFYTLFAKGALLDGWPGWYYALQRTFAESLLSWRLLQRRIRSVRRPAL